MLDATPKNLNISDFQNKWRHVTVIRNPLKKKIKIAYCLDIKIIYIARHIADSGDIKIFYRARHIIDN